MVGCISRPPNLSLSVSRLILPFAFSLRCIPLHLRSLENCAELVGEVTVRLWLSREFSGFLCALPLIRRVAGFVFSVLRRALRARVSLPSTITSSNQEWSSSRSPHLPSSFLSRSAQRRRDLTLCGPDVFRACCRAARINRTVNTRTRNADDISQIG